MYKQVSDFVIIYAKVKDKETGIYKNWNVMKKWGCLYTSLLYIVEQATGKYFSPSQIKLLYRYLVLNGSLGKDMFVHKHEKVLQAGLEMLGFEGSSVEYRAKIDKVNNSKSWGSTFKANFQLLEVETENNNHHFKHINFDPYHPEPVVKKVLSERYYEIHINKTY